MKTKIAENIKYHRHALNLTQGELAEKLGGKFTKTDTARPIYTHYANSPRFSE